jgi:hypothetical protein
VKERSWTLSVRDERGKRHRGVVSFGERPPKRSPEPPSEFHIALLTAATTVRSVPGATAVCVPRLAREAAILGARSELAGIAGEIAEIKRGHMSDARHAQYRAGEVLLPAGSIDAAKVFGRGAKVDFEHLALVLVDMHRSETLAPYLAIIRHELGVPPAANALLALSARLFPADANERPPARAPGIVRLRRVLKNLTAGDEPAMTLDDLTQDLRFLRLFERTEHVLRRVALDRLLADVAEGERAPAARAPGARAPGARAPVRIIKLHRRGDA